jgi:DNA-binding NtrC family response regulator
VKQAAGGFSPVLLSKTVTQCEASLIFLSLGSYAGMTPIAAVQAIKDARPEIPLMIAVDDCPPSEIFRLLDAGLDDFITPPFSPVNILPRIRQILGRSGQVKSLTQSLTEKFGLKQLIGGSPKFIAEIEKIPLVAKCDANVLISGETGTGKELCARAIHYLSRRSRKPLIPINCGATPVELLENELFGHERGAFTGAWRSQPGLIQEADGGTLFLDEIDCLPQLAQVKLLRFIQNKEYRALGSTKTLTADVRIICATNTVIEDAVRDGRFRQDLYYRINIIPLKLPPLRERPEDISLLTDHFVDKYATEFEKQVKGLSSKAMMSLKAYQWPGNVRELEHIIERAIALSNKSLLDELDVPTSTLPEEALVSFQRAKAKVVKDFEVTYINGLLLAHQGNITRAAQVARKNRRAFWQLIRKHGIDVHKFKPATSPL